MGVKDGVLVGVPLGLALGVAVDVGDNVGVADGVTVNVGVTVGLLLGVAVGVKVGVPVGVSVGLLVGVVADLDKFKQAEEFLSLAQWNILKHPEADVSLKAELHQTFGLLYASDGKLDLALKQLSQAVCADTDPHTPAEFFQQRGRIARSCTRVHHGLRGSVRCPFRCVASTSKATSLWRVERHGQVSREVCQGCGMRCAGCFCCPLQTYFLTILNGPSHVLTSFGYFDLGNVFAATSNMDRFACAHVPVRMCMCVCVCVCVCLWLSAAARGSGDELVMTSGCCSLCPVLQKGAYWRQTCFLFDDPTAEESDILSRVVLVCLQSCVCVCVCIVCYKRERERERVRERERERERECVCVCVCVCVKGQVTVCDRKARQFSLRYVPLGKGKTGLRATPEVVTLAGGVLSR